MKNNTNQTLGIKIGLPNSSNKGFDIKAGMIDSNAVYANDIKLYDSNDKGAMSMSFAICDIECKEILGHSKMETSSTSKNTASTINTASQGDTSHFIYQDSNITAKEVANDDNATRLIIESKANLLDYQGNTADTLMAGVSGIFGAMEEGAEQIAKLAIEQGYSKKIKALKYIFQAEGALVSLTYNYGNNGNDMLKAGVSVGIEIGVGSIIGIAAATLSMPVWALVAISAITAVGISLLLNTQSGKNIINSLTDKLHSFFSLFDSNPSKYELVSNPRLESNDYKSLIELLLDSKSNALDIDTLLHTFPNYLAYPTNAKDSTNQEITSISNAIPMHITAQLFNHQNKPLSNREIYVYSPNFYAFVDKATSDEFGFIEFHNACVSSKMTNSDLYFVLNRYGLDEEQKDFHIKISPSKTIQPKDKKAGELINQTMFFVKNIPKAIAFNDSIMPSIKVSDIEYLPSHSQTDLETITLKAHYSLKDSYKQYIQGDKQSYLTQAIQRHKHKTKWGYIVFNKDEDIEEVLNNLNKTKPLIKSARFKEIEGITGEVVTIPFKKEWEDKQVRFFAYLWRADKDVGVDVEIQDIEYTIIYDEDKEANLFADFNHINWQSVAIEIISLIPALKGVRVITRAGKSVLKFIPKKAKKYQSRQFATRAKKAKSKPIKEVKLNTLSRDAQEAYYGYKAHRWQGTYSKQNKGVAKKNEVRANGKFHNNDSKLPIKPKGTYKKFDIINRHDSRRFVRDSQTGDVYYTPDHYETFSKIIE